MFGKRMIAMVPAVVLALGGAQTAEAQAEIDALVIWDVQSSDRLAQGCRVLGYTLTEARSSETEFIAFLNAQSWDFVGIELPLDTITQKETVVQLLEDHVAAGGRLLVNYNNLDEWPRLQTLLGLDSVNSFSVAKERIGQADPIHASWGVFQMGQQGSPWPDAGDELVAAPESEIASLFNDQTVATVVANNWRTIVNGFDWSSYGGGGPSVISKEQIKYLMRCPADYDPSTGRGTLDIFDFLEFQRLFLQQSPKANLAFDQRFDIFDFLEFQNAFAHGCE